MDTTEQAFKEVAPEMRTLNNCPGTTPGTPMSKNQLKKQRKLAEFAELRKLRREREREKKKQKRREAKELGLPVRTGPSRKELKKRQVAEGGKSGLSVAIDLDYDDLMQERDIVNRAICTSQASGATVRSTSHSRRTKAGRTGTCSTTSIAGTPMFSRKAKWYTSPASRIGCWTSCSPAAPTSSGA
ncbi:tRNA methyltransferase 10 homolog A isoform X2 [Drosophila simulans]|uniref:tRNA methyltransferase 10 homolog A isoform X2 n=1 Tax=Drosophila simulans TaxID=7240 RepID=UPI00078AF1DF|nr:tRNA methyltransferase 10 homolog A isoform X2 [Drosophila simulans]KMZ10980.1 uncharacterized protein Dsimw501_GD17543, isoform C [Drosophila simulans]